MAYEYTCQICGLSMEGDTEDGLVQEVQMHLKNSHSMQQSRDVTEPNLAHEEDEIRSKIKQKDD